MSSRAKFNMVMPLFLAVCFVCLFFYQKVVVNDQALHCEVVNLKVGYGYKILKGEKILIIQEFIPGLPGNQVFKTKGEALSVANLVLSKIDNGESPILMPSDISKLDISTASNN
tara:strand:+ start:239 stop:580 length:342 start_codon:yes stop_codon:yes gene_type:complete